MKPSPRREREGYRGGYEEGRKEGIRMTWTCLQMYVQWACGSRMQRAGGVADTTAKAS